MSLPSVGTIRIRHPITGEEMDYALPGGGRGFIRPASLVSLWSTAPFLQNNAVGPFEWQPSVAARMRSFEASIEQMLWPEKRERDPLFPNPGPGVGVIDRMTEDSYLEVPESYIAAPLRSREKVARFSLLDFRLPRHAFVPLSGNEKRKTSLFPGRR